MSPRLTSLTVENFRSISGTQRVSLDAPVVLIHGPNGTGKTSLLSALELGLTGAVASLERIDPGYLKHLPHKKSPTGIGRVLLEAEGLPKSATELTVDGTQVRGEALLTPDASRFFTERCYLPQAALGRLLEIYEHQDSRRSDSPLTRFVKELLGLESLDALIDGLHASGDVRRLREAAPLFWDARAEAPTMAQALDQAQTTAASAQAHLANLDGELRVLLGDLISPKNGIDPNVIEPRVRARLDEQEARLRKLARVRRDLAAAADQVAELLASDAGGQRAVAESAAATAREGYDAWYASDGVKLEALVADVRKEFSDVSSVSSGPAAACQSAAAAVETEVSRLQAIAEADQKDEGLLAETQESIRQGIARVASIETELATDKGANQELAQALSAISAHIHGDACPVCGRDFTEVSATPLAAHISEEVSRLIAVAGRVEALIRDRSTTLSAVTEAKRRESELLSRRLTSKRRDEIKVDLARLMEWKTSLDGLVGSAARGTSLLAASVLAAQTLSGLNTLQSSVSGLRAQIVVHAQELEVQPPEVDASLNEVVAYLRQEVDRQEVLATAAKGEAGATLEALERLVRLRVEANDAKTCLEETTKINERMKLCRAEADRRIAVGRDLAGRAQAVRTEKVRQVFNKELNSVWRELFIRLAPEEDFVPAFALPSTNSGPVEAVLETLYRSGGKGGNPRAMLSAGNLNTAALTLFLALHLSVKPSLPWLVIDDPVQSMDDVHIAQFTALLRTLKVQGRQVILAVHDRQLFDYLTLELSPTFNGDRLITIELGRNADGMTTAPWIPTIYEPDKAIAA